MSDSVRPHRRQPTRLPRPWDSPGKNTGVGGHSLLQCMKVKSESEVAQSCPTLPDRMDCSPPGSSVHGIFSQENWSGVPLPSPSKVLHSLIQISSFLLLTVIFCSFYMPSVAKLLYILILPLHDRRSFLRVTQDAASRAWSPKISCKVKQNFHIVLFFFQSANLSMLVHQLYQCTTLTEDVGLGGTWRWRESICQFQFFL